MTERPTTRLAPSPTGALHLGNARTFLVTWALARQRGWRVVLRIEDLDGPRVKPEAITGCIETLRWLGLDWDEGPIVQTDDLGPHRSAMARLARAGCVFPTKLTRREIAAAASAPHDGSDTSTSNDMGGDVVFPRSLRPPLGPVAFADEATDWRFVVEDGTVGFEDAFAGEQSIEPAKTIGDFVVWTRREQPAYQLAVVVDDARQGVTQVIRGDDLLDSTARQLLLLDALGLPRPREYWHLPLVIGEDGRRLAKRHGDTRLDHYREAGVEPERVIGLLAEWCGLGREPMSARVFSDRFDADTMPQTRITFRAEDDRWLLND